MMGALTTTQFPLYEDRRNTSPTQVLFPGEAHVQRRGNVLILIAARRILLRQKTVLVWQ